MKCFCITYRFKESGDSILMEAKKWVYILEDSEEAAVGAFLHTFVGLNSVIYSTDEVKLEKGKMLW